MRSEIDGFGDDSSTDFILYFTLFSSGDDGGDIVQFKMYWIILPTAPTRSIIFDVSALLFSTTKI